MTSTRRSPIPTLGIAVGGALVIAFLAATAVLGNTVKATTGGAFASPWFTALYWSVPVAALLCCLALTTVLMRHQWRAAGASAVCAWIVILCCWGAVAASFETGRLALVALLACLAIGIVAGVLAVALVLFTALRSPAGDSTAADQPARRSGPAGSPPVTPTGAPTV